MPENIKPFNGPAQQETFAAGIEAELTASELDKARPFRPTTRPRMVGGDRGQPEAKLTVRDRLNQALDHARQNTVAAREVAESLGVDCPEQTDNESSTVGSDFGRMGPSVPDITQGIKAYLSECGEIIGRINRAL